MGSAASTDVKNEIQAKSVDEIAAALKELPADQLAKVKDALSSGDAAAKGPCPGPVDTSKITVVAKDYKGLLAQPAEPKFKGALAQIFVRSQPYGGSDKSNNGHRYDSMAFANGMISSGMSCQLIHYTHEEHDVFFEMCKAFNFIIVRCNPGQIKADGGDQQKFDDGMRELRKAGIQVWPSPDVMEKMGAKDALCKVATLNIGLEDTLAYYSPEDFAAGFKKTMAFQPRVIKQNRGSSGEGIWIIKLAEGNYCKEYGERSCEDGEVLKLMEANDNHEETHTVAEFIEFCVSGRTDKSGEWTSKGVGKYLEGGKAAGGQLVDQRFCPRIVEGELRYNLIVDALVGIIHKKPKEGGISAVGGTGSIYTYYGPEEATFKTLTDNFLQKDLPKVMPSLELAEEPVPLWWTTDFILASPEGTPKEEEKWIVGEFNCSCVGVSRCLAAYCKDDTPNACWDDIAEEDKAEAKKYGDLMGEKALGILSK
ncbi:hace1 [Symbiodinium pilosum]|uniref:Hace1 protein n=1 Tax=Symbiodinium pilosum TaxID=2952 RepID=A0A812XIY6_SYMPI|nr:hace1 [Symbiodinium pilosum]